MSPDTYAIADFISSVLANKHCSFFADKPSEAKGMFTQPPGRGPCPYPRSEEHCFLLLSHLGLEPVTSG
jgi:hypothetical protein